MLVNESTPGEQPLSTETVVGNTLLVPPTFDTGWAPMTAPAVPVTAGQRYRLEIRTVFTQHVLQAAQGTFTFRFDNIGLRVADGTPTFVSAPTAITDPATDVTATSATLNGRTNAHGLPSTYSFRYGTAANLAGATVIGPLDAGSRTDPQPRSRTVTGLAACTTYFFRIEATNAVAGGTGDIRSFRTSCRPSVLTLPVTGVGPNAATFNSRINPEGLATTYAYEYRVKGAAAFIRAPATPLELPAGRGQRAPGPPGPRGPAGPPGPPARPARAAPSSTSNRRRGWRCPHRCQAPRGPHERPQHRPRPRADPLPPRRGAHVLGQHEGAHGQQDPAAQPRVPAEAQAPRHLGDGCGAARRRQDRLCDLELQRPAAVGAQA